MKRLLLQISSVRIKTHEIGYESMFENPGDESNPTQARGVPQDLYDPRYVWARGSNGESPVRESTAAVQEPQPKSPWQAAAKATQGLCPAETLSAVSGDWHSTFPDSNACFQNEHGEKVLVCRSNVMALDISGHF